LGLVGVYLRAKLADTPAFEAMERESEERERQQREASGGFRELARPGPCGPTDRRPARRCR
jgi:hypothetical protein